MSISRAGDGAATGSVGQHQIDQAQFKLRKGKSSSVVSFDLKKDFSYLFSKSVKVPKTLYKYSCDALDKEFSQQKGAYFFAADAVIYVLFDSLPLASAKVRVEQISKAISKRINDNSESAQVDVARELEQKSSSVGYGDEALRKVMEGHLPVNPTDKMMDCWVNRVKSDLTHSAAGKFWTVDLLRLAKDAPLKYRPVWGPKAKMILANFVFFQPVQKAENSNELVRRDVAMLVAGAMETLRLSKQKSRSLIVVPVNYKTLQDKEVVELYSTILAHVPKDLCQSLLMELRNVPNEGVSGSVQENLSKLVPFFKAVFVETGLLSIPDVAYAGFSPHAYGVDLRGNKFTPDHLMSLLRKYNDTARSKGVKCYLKGVDDATVLKRAAEMGFDYIGGHTVSPDRSGCLGMVPFDID